MSDIVCDFCGAEWVDTLPMVEGHHGSCICGNCLTVAYTSVILCPDLVSPTPSDSAVKCTLCLEHRDERHWSSPTQAAQICKRCINQSAGVLHKDPDFAWSKPKP